MPRKLRDSINQIIKPSLLFSSSEALLPAFVRCSANALIAGEGLHILPQSLAEYDSRCRFRASLVTEAEVITLRLSRVNNLKI